MSIAEDRTESQEASWVRQDEKLILGYYSMSTNEMRIIWEMAARIRPDDLTFREYEFTLPQLREITGENLTFASGEALIEKLFNRKLEAEIEPGVRELARWVVSAKLDSNTQTFRVAFNPDLTRYFVRLKSYVMSEREHLRSLSSEYAVRLFLWSCARRNMDVQTWEVPILELRKRLGIERDQYERFSNLKARVLESPIEEINDKLGPAFRLSYKVRKRGVEPVAVMFHLDAWPTTTTGTGAVVQQKIAAKRKRTAAKIRAGQPSEAAAPEREYTPEETAKAGKQFAAIKAKLRGRQLPARV